MNDDTAKEVYGNRVWPEATAQKARETVVEAAMHMTDHRDGSQGVTVARNQFSAKWTVLDGVDEHGLRVEPCSSKCRTARGEPPNEEPFIVLRHRPTHEIVGYYRTVWPNDVEGVEELGAVFHCPEMLPGTPVRGEIDGDRYE